MSDVKVTIDNIEVNVPEGSTLLEAAHIAGVDIPTLCYLKDVNEIGACRMCLCEVEGARALAAACVFPVFDGMVAHTNTPKIFTASIIRSQHGLPRLLQKWQLRASKAM